MTSSPIIIPPATPSELITYILANHRYPTTIIILSYKQPFLDALIHEVQSTEHESNHTLLHKCLLQTAVARHLRMVFAPTITHLRSYLTIFAVNDDAASKFNPPQDYNTRPRKPPLLLVYGLLEGHRVTDEWSAQGITNTAAALVEAAARNSLTAGVVEPRGGGDGLDNLDDFLNEQVPVLSGTVMRESGAWSGRTVDVRSVLGRWFAEQPEATTT